MVWRGRKKKVFPCKHCFWLDHGQFIPPTLSLFSLSLYILNLSLYATTYYLISFSEDFSLPAAAPAAAASFPLPPEVVPLFYISTSPFLVLAPAQPLPFSVTAFEVPSSRTGMYSFKISACCFRLLTNLFTVSCLI